jgi:hypothetical protein
MSEDPAIYKTKQKPLHECFQTPIPICDYMISLIPKSKGPYTILEPTPGNGNIVDRLLYVGYPLYWITAPKDFFLLDFSKKYDCIIMNPPFSAKYAFLENAGPHIKDYQGMRLGYFILQECLKMSDHVIALMPWFTISDSDVRLRFIKNWGLKSLIALPRTTFEYTRIQTCIFEMEKGFKGETIFRSYEQEMMQNKLYKHQNL